MTFGRRQRFRKLQLHSSKKKLFTINSYRWRLLRVKLANKIISYLIIGFIILLVLFFLQLLWYAKDLPAPDKIRRREGFTTLILDRNKKPIYDIYTDKNRIPVPLSDIPDYLKKATISIEDKDFYKHQGFDTRGIIRSVFNLITFRGLQGGSTLTQQLVKNVLLTSERTLPRKIKEFILSIEIERKYSKDDILQMYLNEAPYGGTMWGIESAAQGYFGKSVRELTFNEAVILAGLPQRPSYYSPFGANPAAYLDRSADVLRRMREDGVINQVQELESKRQLPQVKFASEKIGFQAAHFVFYVKKELIEKFGEKKVAEGGLRVITTLDLALQEKAEKILQEELDKLKNLNVGNGAVIVLDPKSGEILTYIGSREYESEDSDFQGKFDVVSMGLRQPGSALKPITYAVAFAKGYTPSSIIMDVETHFPGGEGKPDYLPKNYDGKYRGPIQLRFALGNSINIPAVKTTALVGIRDILKTAYAMGVSSFAPTDENVNRLGLSITLGGGEVRLLDLAAAYGVFATGGIKNNPYAISSVEDSNGKEIYKHEKSNGSRVLGKDVSFLVSHILADNNARKEIFGERSYLAIAGKTVSVKTGTTDDKRDNWTIGYTPSIVAGVWVGNNDNSPMDPKLASGVTGASPIWNRIIREALKDKPNEEFTLPENVSALTVDAYAGGLAYEGKPTRSEYFIRGTEPTKVSSVYKKIKLSKSDNKKLANEVEIAQGNYTEHEFIIFRENDPTGNAEINRWQEGIDSWLKTQSDEIYHPPAETSGENENTVFVQIKKPQDKTQSDNNNLEIEAIARAVADIKKMELYIDDTLKFAADGNSLYETITLEIGIHKIKVKAYDNKSHSGESEITIGVKVPAEVPSLTPVPIPTATITPSEISFSPTSPP